MLQEMRKYTKSWLGAAIIGVPVIISFVIWGIADVFRGNTDVSLAMVGDQKVTPEAFQRDYRAATRQITKYAPLKPAQAKAIAQQTLDRLIDQRAVTAYVQRYGLVMSDDIVNARIREIPQFAGPLGTFDRSKFQSLLQQVGFQSEQEFIDLIREELIRSQFYTAASGALEVPPGYAHMLFNYLNEVRAAEYVVLPANAAGSLPEPTDAQLKAFVAAHPGRFSTPEYREVSFAWLAPSDLIGQMKVTDDQIRQQYELQKSQFVVPETREIEQLVFPSEAAAKAARAKIDSGTSFADLAKQQGKSAQDISLGNVVKADLGERGNVAFALPKDGVSQPVKAPIGYALLHVANITPGSTKTLNDVKEDLRKQIASQLAAAKIGDLGNQYIDESSRGESLAQAAKKVGMHVGHVAAIDSSGNTPDGTKAQIPDDLELQQQMFKADVGEEGDPFVAKSGATYVVKVEGVRPPKLKPLDAVRAEALRSWQTEENAHRLEAKAKALAVEATSVKSLAPVASSVGSKVEHSSALRRPLQGSNEKQSLPDALLTKIFSVPEGDAVYAPTEEGGSYIIARVTGVKHPPAALLDMRMKQFATQVGTQVGADIDQSVAAAAREREGVTVNQQNVDRFVSGGEGS